MYGLLGSNTEYLLLVCFIETSEITEVVSHRAKSQIIVVVRIRKGDGV